jgi:hypothetical protein
MYALLPLHGVSEVYMLYGDTDDDDDDDNDDDDDDDEDDVDEDEDDDLIMMIIHALPSLNIIAYISLSSFFTYMYTIRYYSMLYYAI